MADTLWLVEIDHDQFDYDCFVSGVVWAETDAEAEALIRAATRLPRDDRNKIILPEGDATRLVVTPATSVGIVHTHWHAG